MLIEERFIGIDNPLSDEEEEMEHYEDEKRKSEIRLIKLEDILGEQ